MKRINLLFMSLLCVWISATAQVGQQSQEPVDSIKNIGYMDSLFQELPEVMITGERPIVKAEQGKLVYDVPRLVGNLPVDNAYDVVKNLPGIVNMNNSLMLGGQEVTVVINGKVTTLSAEQLDALLKGYEVPIEKVGFDEIKTLKLTKEALKLVNSDHSATIWKVLNQETPRQIASEYFTVQTNKNIANFKVI